MIRKAARGAIWISVILVLTLFALMSLFGLIFFLGVGYEEFFM